MTVYLVVMAWLVLGGLFAALVSVLAPVLGVPGWVIGLVLAPAGLWCAVHVVMWPVSRRLRQAARARSTPDLEARVWCDPADYFRFLGDDEAPAVRRFRALVQARDLPGLQAAWPGLRRQFQQLEVRAGHRGRPLLLDLFGSFDVDLRELAARRRPGGGG